MGIEQAFAEFLEPVDARDIAFMHAVAREKQYDLTVWPVCAIEVLVFPQESVVAHVLAPRFRVLKEL
jgi:hypothetical protein